MFFTCLLLTITWIFFWNYKKSSIITILPLKKHIIFMILFREIWQIADWFFFVIYWGKNIKNPLICAFKMRIGIFLLVLFHNNPNIFKTMNLSDYSRFFPTNFHYSPERKWSGSFFCKLLDFLSQKYEKSADSCFKNENHWCFSPVFFWQ